MYAVIRDASIGGTPVIDIAKLGKRVGEDRYNVQFVDVDGTLRERTAYERWVVAGDVFATLAQAQQHARAIVATHSHTLP